MGGGGPFRGNEIRLHTKSGGVILGEVHGDVLEVVLPEPSIKRFKKAGYFVDFCWMLCFLFIHLTIGRSTLELIKRWSFQKVPI